MPSSKEHIDQATKNLQFLESFILKASNDWAITVMFYTSLHIAEALIFQEANRKRYEENIWDYEIHSTNHDHRERQIKGLFKEIHYYYSELSTGATDGRYKIYRFRNEEVIDHFDNHFTPIVDFFNKYCKSNELSFCINLDNIAKKVHFCLP
jgi:hypothetical protein